MFGGIILLAKDIMSISSSGNEWVVLYISNLGTVIIQYIEVH